MAITSVGYDGSINETQWAIMAPRMSMPYWVEDVDALKATILKDKDRTISLNPGRFGGQGVMDQSTAVEEIAFAPVASGNRYDLVVARRNWQGDGGTTTLEAIEGSTTKKIPSFNRGPGLLDDQLLYLVHLQAGRTTPVSVIDLRGFGLNSRVQLFDPLALEGYNNWPGLQAQIGREEYTLQVDRTWVRTGLISAVSPAYRLRLRKSKKISYGGGLKSVGPGWSVSGDNTMGLKVLSNGKVRVTKAGIYSFSTNVFNYGTEKHSEGTYRFRIDGLWVMPTYESHRNTGTNGWEQSLDWTGVLNVGDTFDFQFAQYHKSKGALTMQFEIQIEMIG